MHIIPAVDIMDGKVVRLLRGDPRLMKSYEFLGDPISVARRWKSEGAPIIHVVDLDAALGRGNNIELIEKMIQSVNVPIQVGGGIRSIKHARRLIEVNAERVVLGSLAFKNPEAIETLLNEFGYKRIVVALDHVNGEVVVNGWKTKTGVMLEEAAKKFLKMGVRFFLVTSVKHDGMMSGPDVENLSRVLDLNANIIASGGIKSLDDIIALRDLGVYGVVIGRALYEGLIDLKEALKVAFK